MEITGFPEYVKTVVDLYDRIDVEKLDQVLDVLEDAYHHEKLITVFGNGGSCATSSHFCEDLAKGTLVDMNNPKRFRIVSLTDNIPFIMALANDCGYETIFEQQLIGLARKGDIAIGISCSGNSPNVLNAIKRARQMGMVTVGFTGYDGGKLADLVQHHIHVPSTHMGIVESIHDSIMHYFVEILKKRIQ